MKRLINWQSWLFDRKLRTLAGIFSKYTYLLIKKVNQELAISLSLHMFILISKPSRFFPYYFGIKKKGWDSYLIMDEGDKRFEILAKLLYKKKVYVYWIPKQILDLCAANYFFRWYNEYRETFDPQKSDRYVNSLDRYWHSENKINRDLYYKLAYIFLKKYVYKTKASKIFFASADDTINFELIKAANSLQIETILCEREGTHTETSAKKLAEAYINTSVLTFDRIFCANERHYHIYKKASLRNTKVELLGELRSDYWKVCDFPYKINKYKSMLKGKKVITFLTFGERNYIEPMFIPKVNGDWNSLRKSIEDQLFKILEDRDDVFLVYKLGHMEDYFKESIDRFEKFRGTQFIDFDRSVDASELMSISNCVVGFQSTATIEALFYKVDVIYPFWSIPTDLDPQRDLLPFHLYEDIFKVCKSAKQLKFEIEKSIDTKFGSDLHVRAKLINNYFYKPGNVAGRLINRLKN